MSEKNTTNSDQDRNQNSNESAGNNSAENTTNATNASDSNSVEAAGGYEKLLEKRFEDSEKAIKDLRSEFRLTGTIGKGKMETLEAKQQIRLQKLHEQYKEKYAALKVGEKNKRKGILLAEATEKMEAVVQPYKMLVDYVKGTDRLDEMELVKLEALMNAMEKLKANPELDAIFGKVLKSRGNPRVQLDDKDYEKLVDFLNPITLGENLSSQSEEIFESGQVGAIIGIMKPAQRFKLVEVIFQRKAAKEAQDILEMLIVSGMISDVQVRALIDQQIIPAPFADELLSQMQSGKLKEKIDEYQKKVILMGQVNKGRTAVNSMSKAFGAPMVMAGLGLYGAATAIVNLLAGWKMGKPMDVLTNPFFLGGTAMAASSIAVGAHYAFPETVEEAKEAILEFAAGPKEQEKIKEQKVDRVKESVKQRLTSNPYLMDFLLTNAEFDDGSHQSSLVVIKKLASDRRAAGQEAIPQFNEFKQSFRGDQLKLLEKAFLADNSNELDFKNRIFAIMAGLNGLQMDNDKNYSDFVDSIKEEQGIK